MLTYTDETYSCVPVGFCVRRDAMKKACFTVSDETVQHTLIRGQSMANNLHVIQLLNIKAYGVLAKRSVILCSYPLATSL